MESTYYNLSEEEFSKKGKILLWIFAALFFVAGGYILVVNLILGEKSIPVILSVAPFGISLVVGIIAILATFKGTGMFFLIDNDKIEYKYGVIKPTDHIFPWNNVKELVMPSRQKKVKLIFKDGSSFVINLTWIQGNKSGFIRKRLYHTAREKDLNVIKVITLSSKR